MIKKLAFAFIVFSHVVIADDSIEYDHSLSKVAESDKNLTESDAKTLSEKIETAIYNKDLDGLSNLNLSHCAEITLTDAAIPTNGKAKIKPTGKLVGTQGTLSQFDFIDSEKNEGIGYLTAIHSYTSPTIVVFETYNDTLWLNDNFELDSEIIVVGYYVDNTQIQLANGTVSTSMKLETLCISKTR